MVVVKDMHQRRSWVRSSCNHVSSRENRIAYSHIRRSSRATPSSHQVSSQTQLWTEPTSAKLPVSLFQPRVLCSSCRLCLRVFSPQFSGIGLLPTVQAWTRDSSVSGCPWLPICLCSLTSSTQTDCSALRVVLTIWDSHLCSASSVPRTRRWGLWTRDLVCFAHCCFMSIHKCVWYILSRQEMIVK